MIDTLDTYKNKDFYIKKPERAENILSKDGEYITKSLSGSAAATAGNYGVIFIANTPLQVSYVSAIWSTASTSGTLNLERLSGTESLGGGDSIFSSTIDLSGTADTVNTRSGKELQNTTLKPGERLALVDGGTLTNLNDLCVTVYLKAVGKGEYR